MINFAVDPPTDDDYDRHMNTSDPRNQFDPEDDGIIGGMNRTIAAINRYRSDTTNDPQAAQDRLLYGGSFTDEHGNRVDPLSVKLPKAATAPLLSYETMQQWWNTDIEKSNLARKVQDFYEAKIASGELMVVKTCTYDDQCSVCGNDVLEVTPSPGWFCPGCNSKIIEG